jgi:hypothetical protein
LANLEVAMFDRFFVKRAALAAVEASLCDRVTEPTADTEDLAGELARAQAEVQVARVGCSGAHGKRMTLIPVWYRERAADYREQAAQRREQFAKHRRQVDKILEKLAELEEVSTEGLKKADPIASTWECEHQRQVASISEPRSERLQREIHELGQLATQSETTNPFASNCSGNVEADNVANLVRGLLQDPTRVTPCLLDVADWAAAQNAKCPGRRLRYHLAYSQGSVMAEESRSSLLPIEVADEAAA